jgi:hypothetical protein
VIASTLSRDGTQAVVPEAPAPPRATGSGRAHNKLEFNSRTLAEIRRPARAPAAHTTWRSE